MPTLDSNPDGGSAVEVEAFDRARRRMLAAVVITSMLWLVPQIVQTALDDDLPRVANGVLVGAGLVGAVAWMGFMWRMH